MIFTEFRFLPFFAVAFLVHWALRKDSHRKLWLLACSYLFYAAWDWRFLSLILGSTVLDWFAGQGIHASENPKTRKRWLTLSICGNLGILGIFKYFGFFAASAEAFLSFLGFNPGWTTLSIVLPVGISFYTFQTMSYSLDIHRKKIQPTKSFIDLAVFVGFFPQLVAGPIVRAAEFLPQLATSRAWQAVDVRGALVLFFIGFFKKACISDNIAVVVDRYFSSPESYNVLSAWVGVTFASVQVYCDFSGYSDMAIACAALLGYKLRENFNFPFFAGDITELWRRWHMSLSSWLRDYLYIPLGGSRNNSKNDSLSFPIGLAAFFTIACWIFVGKSSSMTFAVAFFLCSVFATVTYLIGTRGQRNTNRNLMLTMLLGGLWHGAAWNYVIWGGMHGLALIFHKEWKRWFPSNRSPGLIRKALGPLLTFWFWALAYLFFRAAGEGENSIQATQHALEGFLFFHSNGTQAIGPSFLIGLIPLLGILHFIAYKGWTQQFWRKIPAWAFAAGLGLITAGMLPFVQPNRQPFIYFQF